MNIDSSYFAGDKLHPDSLKRAQALLADVEDPGGALICECNRAVRICWERDGLDLRLMIGPDAHSTYLYVRPITGGSIRPVSELKTHLARLAAQ